MSSLFNYLLFLSFSILGSGSKRAMIYQYGPGSAKKCKYEDSKHCLDHTDNPFDFLEQ